MPVLLSGSVGQGGANRSPDVKAVQSALNTVSPTRGGAAPPLDVDGFVGQFTVGAIRRFQKLYFSDWSDGRIDPGQRTHRQLDQELDSPPPAANWPYPAVRDALVTQVSTKLLLAGQGSVIGPWLNGLTPARLHAIEVALGEAISWPGRVSDRLSHMNVKDPWDGKPERVRDGWMRLREYFDVACPGFLRMDVTEMRKGILCWDRRVKAPGLPQAPGTTEGVHWCGIFATWVYKQAHGRVTGRTPRPLRWKFPLISMPYTDGTYHKGPLTTRPGDVGVVQKNTHHFVIISPPQADGRVWAVDGNSDYQSVLVQPHAAKDIRLVYDADDMFL